MKPITPIQAIYLFLAGCGAVGTWYFNLRVEPPSQFFQLIWQTPVSCSMAIDLLVTVAAFFVLMVCEHRRLGISRMVIGSLMVLTFAVALAFTFPLFLFFRERS